MAQSSNCRKEQGTSIASPDGALSFLFGIFGLLLWYMSTSTSITPATMLTVGIIWIILSLGTLCAAFLNLFRGRRRGNMNLIAAVLLGFFPGINTLVSLFALSRGDAYAPVISGFMYILGSLYAFGFAFIRMKKPLYVVIRTSLVALGLFFLGLGDLCGSHALLACGGWNLLAFSLLSFYFGLSTMYPAFGSRLPQGIAADEFLRRIARRRRRS